jgi:hypothetical protein
MKNKIIFGIALLATIAINIIPINAGNLPPFQLPPECPIWPCDVWKLANGVACILKESWATDTNSYCECRCGRVGGVLQCKTFCYGYEKYQNHWMTYYTDFVHFADTAKASNDVFIVDSMAKTCGLFSPLNCWYECSTSDMLVVITAPDGTTKSNYGYWSTTAWAGPGKYTFDFVPTDTACDDVLWFTGVTRWYGNTKYYSGCAA